MDRKYQNKRATRLYNFIVRYYAENGYFLTLREMTDVLGNNSTSIARAYVDLLEKRGWVRRIESQSARALKLTRPTERGLTPDQLAALLGVKPVLRSKVAIDPARLAQIGG